MGDAIKYRLKSGGTFELNPAYPPEWQRLYPKFDVDIELRRASLWLEANPTRRKTRAGMLRFLTSWLARASQNGAGPATRPSGYAEPARGVDWWEECKRLHGGRCEKRATHLLRLESS